MTSANGRGGPALRDTARLTIQTPELRERKRVARATARDRRARLIAGREAAAAAARDRFLAELPPKPGTVVSAFWPLEDEFDARPLLYALHEAGAVCALPVVTARDAPLSFREWAPGCAMAENVMGVQAPGEAAPERRPEIVVVPLLAWDDRGYRLGYGGGYYDRTLARLRRQGGVLAVGLAFAGQQVAEVPRGPGDERLDMLVHERGTERFAAE